MPRRNPRGPKPPALPRGRRAALGCDGEAALDEHAIAHFLDQGIARTVRYAYAHSPFYRERFDAAGIKPGDIASCRDLAALPLTSKKDVAEADRKLWCVPMEKVVDICTTSGTTGTATLYPMTEGDLRRLGYNEYLSFGCAGLSARDVVLLATTMDRCFIAGLAYFEGLRQTGAAIIRVGSGPPSMLLGLLDRLRPTAAVSVPSFLKKVSACAAESGVDLAGSTVKKLVCIGEPLRAPDFALTHFGKHLATAWGARMYSTYGITELAVSLCECDAGRGGHLHPELVHLEVVDDDGRPVADGEAGEIVATTIGVEAMPLVRFQTGDCSFLDRRPCAGGRRTPRIGPILGRKNQKLKIKGTTVYPAAVQRVLNDLDFVIDYVMIATSPSPLSDELEVVVAVRGDADPSCRRIREQLAGQLKVTPNVRAAGLGEVERLQNSRESRKKQVLIDRRRQQVGR